MDISGVLIQTRPENLQQVSGHLAKIPGVDIHLVDEKGRIVITVEKDNSHQLADAVLNLQSVVGVVSAQIVYHESVINE